VWLSKLRINVASSKSAVFVIVVVVLFVLPESVDELHQRLITSVNQVVPPGHSGRIWQGHFKAFSIANNDQLLTVLRYVERNPVD